ncbi:MAG: elongation factor G [Candidatus Omnitrophota bacterium]|nr:MAG: elongation factor G [Candidatus Omnitrophota bacterium]
MRTDLSKKRTFLLCGHAQSGKTSLAEAILFKVGATSRYGTIGDGTTASDYEEDEKERKSSINLSVLYGEHKGYFLQFIDTPGYFDFIGELISSARASDFAIVVVDATAGVEVGTERAWETLRKENLPCLFFINKLDKENTNFSETLEDIRNNLTKKAIPFVVLEANKITNILEDKSNPSYNQIVETVAESDDALLEKYLESGSLDEKELAPALKNAIVNSHIFPVIGGVATEQHGIDTLLKFLCDVMPSAKDANARVAKKSEEDIAIQAQLDAPLAAQVFKTIIDPYVGQLNIFRVFSGKLPSNSEVFNSNKEGKEKFGQVYILQGKQQVPQDGISAGEIGAVAKLKDTATGETLCVSSRKIQFPTLEFPPPAYSASVKPKSRQDEEKISTALSRLTSEDPTFKVSRDTQTKELIISGMGELHLNVIIDRMKRKYGANVDLGTPKVPYKETVTKSVKVQGKYKKQTGGRGQYGDCWIEVEPLERGKNFEFVNKVVGGAIPRNFIPSVEKGVRKAMQTGILAGFPLSDIRVILYDGSYHPVDSSDIAFQVAGSMALKKALEEAGSMILEPIMDVEIVVPEEFMGQVTGDINARRGRVLGMEIKGRSQIVKAQVPLGEMFKYASDLRSVTGGRGSYTMSFSRYEIVPTRIAQTIIEEAKRKKKEEEAS